MPDTHHQRDAKAAIRALAERYHVTYRPADADLLAHHLTRLSGDDVVFDEIEQRLIALQRAERLSRTEAVLLQADYLRQAKP